MNVHYLEALQCYSTNQGQGGAGIVFTCALGTPVCYVL